MVALSMNAVTFFAWSEILSGGESRTVNEVSSASPVTSLLELRNRGTDFFTVAIVCLQLAIIFV
jgi:hypothetical protein